MKWVFEGVSNPYNIHCMVDLGACIVLSSCVLRYASLRIISIISQPLCPFALHAQRGAPFTQQQSHSSAISACMPPYCYREVLWCSFKWLVSVAGDLEASLCRVGRLEKWRKRTSHSECWFQGVCKAVLDDLVGFFCIAHDRVEKVPEDLRPHITV
jgi:hypothetical protein